jgi:hypothetical protein
MSTILCAGLYETLLETRRLILEFAGHTVVTAQNSPQIITACQNYAFAFAIVGQSGDASKDREWTAVIRTYSPETKILEIFLPNFGPNVPNVDAWHQGPEDPRTLVATIAALSTGGAKSARVPESE